MAGGGDRPAAIVTGAGSGIGRATALMLGRRGWLVALAGRREGPLRETAAKVEELGGGAVCVAMDVADDHARRRLVAEAARAFGRVDALINNAGYAPMTPLGDMTDEMRRRVFEVNAGAPISLARAAWDVFARQSGGRVVNVSSVASVDPFPGLGVYGAAKAALNLATLAMTREGEGIGVRAFAVAPGAVETPMLRSIVDESSLPTGACLTPDDVAGVIVACAVGDRDQDAGATIFLPGPGEAERVVRPGL